MEERRFGLIEEWRDRCWIWELGSDGMIEMCDGGT